MVSPLLFTSSPFPSELVSCPEFLLSRQESPSLVDRVIVWDQDNNSEQSLEDVEEEECEGEYDDDKGIIVEEEGSGSRLMTSITSSSICCVLSPPP